MMQIVKRLDLQDALTLIEGAATKATGINVPMCISVVDDGGHMIAFQRMEGGKILSVTLSDDKAYTAAISRKGTHEYNERCIPGNLVFGIHTSQRGRFSLVGGGLPIFQDEQVVGAIGCSGGMPEQDIECAQAGIDHRMARMRVGQ